MTGRRVGIDIGGTNMRVALVEADGALVSTRKHTIEGRLPEEVVRQVRALVHKIAPGEDLPVAVGLAAQLSTPEGFVAVAPNLGWREVPFGAMLSASFARPVRLVNDLNAITAGEAWTGVGRGAEHLICVFVGTGVGMGAVVHGRVLEGTRGLATELGHIKVEDAKHGRLCGCGQRGCLEAYASGRHLPELYAEKRNTIEAAAEAVDTLRGDKVVHKTLGKKAEVDAGSIEAAATAGQAAAVALWDDVGERLGRALGNLVTLFNPELIVLGGGVLQASPSLAERVRRRTEAYASHAHFAAVSMVNSSLGDNAGAIGAAYFAAPLPQD